MNKEQIKQLEEHSLMLGRIANLVEEFCEEDDTTLQGVAKLLARYRDLQAKDAWDFVDQLAFIEGKGKI
jgi:hypothetical protein